MSLNSTTCLAGLKQNWMQAVDGSTGLSSNLAHIDLIARINVPLFAYLKNSFWPSNNSLLSLT